MIDKKILLAAGAALLILLLALVIGSYCGAPAIVDQRAGNLRMACLFPRPWSLVFGIGMRIYDFNIYVCAIVPGLVLLLWFLSALRKDE